MVEGDCDEVRDSLGLIWQLYTSGYSSSILPVHTIAQIPVGNAYCCCSFCIILLPSSIQMNHASFLLNGTFHMLSCCVVQVVLETEITNKSALKLYENLGFVRDKRLFRYYLNGVDALRLKLWLRWVLLWYLGLSLSSSVLLFLCPSEYGELASSKPQRGGSRMKNEQNVIKSFTYLSPCERSYCKKKKKKNGGANI